MMHEKFLRLYHSTDRAGYEMASVMGRLFGQEILHPPSGYSGAANLTTDKEAARAFILNYRGSGQWTVAEGPPELFILTFSLPNRLLKYVGTTRYLGSEEYATILTVDVRDLPDQYLENQHAATGVHRITRSEALKLQLRRERRFYQVPFEYYRGVEPVQFTWEGVTYPINPSA